MKTDDPQFTAHVLGELDALTPAERAEIEALLQADPSAAMEAAETRKIAEVLRRDLQGEEMPPLTGAQRARVLAARAADATFEMAKVVSFPRRTAILSAIAACLIVGAFVALFARMSQQHTAAVRLARENSYMAVPEIEILPPESNEPVPVSETAVLSLQIQTASPNIDVISTTAPTASFQSSPSKTIAHLQKSEVNIARLSIKNSGSPVLGGLPGTMRGRMNAGNVAAARSTPWPKIRFGVNGTPRSEEESGEALPQTGPGNTESYDSITDNAFLAVRENPLSTFSADVDTASYAIVRRFLNERKLPPKGAVRIEELLNYFTYQYPQPQGDGPFSATMEVAACPWAPAHRLVRIGLKGREIAKDKRPASNLVFLIDVSGSMQPANKLPLLKQSLGLLIDQLGEEDSVAMVVYAGSSGCVLQPTHDKAEMRLALDRLEAGGSTNGASGIELAYELARKNFIKGGTNRVILATDGDWNVGVTNQRDLLEMIANKAKGGVFLTVLGFGMGNLKDAMLVKLADKGNGNYAYLDTLLEAKKVLVEQFSGTLVTIAKDVKIQVEFNPAHVAAYRLIGYEKRLLAKEDFNDDKKDAGEIGAGHTVTALYEAVPAGGDVPPPGKVDALKYQTPAPEKSEIRNQKSEISPEMLTLKLRYKAPDGDTGKLLEFPLTDSGAAWEKSSRDFRFAAAVAGYGMLLRDSPHKGSATWDSIRELAVEGKGGDAAGYRAEFISLLEKARGLMR